MPRTITPPTWFRIVAVLLVLWGLMGVGACVQQLRLGAEAMGPASGYDRALYASLPGWYNGVYAVAVAAGLLGSVALVARRRVAVPLYLVSLLAVVVQFGWLFAATDIIAVSGAATVVPFPLFIAGLPQASSGWRGGRWRAAGSRERGRVWHRPCPRPIRSTPARAAPIRHRLRLSASPCRRSASASRRETVAASRW